MQSLRFRLTHGHPEATAAGLYGIIVGAAVVAAAHAERAVAVAVSVLVTLIVYWAAERYARIIAERVHEGHRPAWGTVRGHLTTGWEMVTTSFLPLLVLVLVRLFGARLVTAEIASLVCSTILLGVAGWRMGGNARLTSAERLVATAVAALFGVSMIVLKTWLH
jgi:positive regulator of sigma E activity